MSWPVTIVDFKKFKNRTAPRIWGATIALKGRQRLGEIKSRFAPVVAKQAVEPLIINAILYVGKTPDMKLDSVRALSMPFRKRTGNPLNTTG